MIADFRSANCLPRFNVPALKCQVAYFKVDAWGKMFVRGERQELFALNGSTSGEKLNKRPTALIAWRGGLLSEDRPEDAHSGVLPFRVDELFIAS
jgi:hypothetical protein